MFLTCANITSTGQSLKWVRFCCDLFLFISQLFRVCSKVSNITRPRLFDDYPFYFVSHWKLFSEVFSNTFSNLVSMLCQLSSSSISAGSVSRITFHTVALCCGLWIVSVLVPVSAVTEVSTVWFSVCSASTLLLASFWMTTEGFKMLQVSLSITMTSYVKD